MFTYRLALVVPTNMHRKAKTTSSYTYSVIDDLTYTYVGPYLDAIQESANPDFGYKGTGGGQTHDPFGRVLNDTRGQSYDYNELSLPFRITQVWRSLQLRAWRE